MRAFLLCTLAALPLAAQTNPTLSTNNTALNFTYQLGAATLPAAQTLSVRGTPNGLTFTVAVAGAPSNGAWLLVSASAGRVPGSLAVQVNPTGLPAGTYNATITITATSGSPPPQVVVTVTLTISTPPPSIQVSPTALTFSYTTGGPIPHSSLTQNFILSSTGSAVSAVVSVQGATWLKVNPSGNISVVGLLNTIAVTVDPTGLTPKVYSGTIKITSAASANQSVNVAVTLTVNAAPPRATGTWPPGLIQGSPLSTVTLVGQNFFANSTVAAAGFINSTTVTVNDGANTATETLNIPIY
nr:hypothetical protein [Bryobacter sp.]